MLLHFRAVPLEVKSEPEDFSFEQSMLNDSASASSSLAGGSRFCPPYSVHYMYPPICTYLIYLKYSKENIFSTYLPSFESHRHACYMIMDEIEDKNPRDENGRTPLLQAVCLDIFPKNQRNRHRSRECVRNLDQRVQKVMS